jgi:nucleoside phosphorylase
LSEGFDDIAVADTVIEHDIDAFAGGLREAGNLAVALTLATDQEQICHDREGEFYFLLTDLTGG